MKKIRIGNDFVFSWAIERGGVPENLETVLEKHLYMIVFGAKTEIHNYTVSGNKIIVEFTPEMLNKIGIYTLIFYYVLPDESLSDNDRKCAVDIDAFQIVPRTAMADDVSEFAVTSDMAIAFKGDKGDSAYQVWLENGNVGTEDDYFAYLRQPATDAAASVSALEQTVSDNEALRVTAEQGRVDAELLRVGAESARSDAEGLRNTNEIDRIAAEEIRNTNETGRINAERDRMDAEVLREQAEAAREEAEDLRQTNTTTAIQNAGEATTAANTAAGLATEAATTANTAAGNANDAATAANTAAGLADTARTELTTAVNTKLDEADDKIEEMDTTLSTYDGRVTQVESDISQLAGDVKQTTEKPTAQSLSELNARITALEAIVTNKIKDRVDVTKEFNVWGKTNLILYGTGANTKAPDFIGQTYIDTTNGNVYIAVGTSNAGNWKLV